MILMSLIIRTTLVALDETRDARPAHQKITNFILYEGCLPGEYTKTQSINNPGDIYGGRQRGQQVHPKEEPHEVVPPHEAQCQQLKAENEEARQRNPIEIFIAILDNGYGLPCW